MITLKVLLLVSLFKYSCQSFNIDDFGAIADNPSFKQALVNGKAFHDAVLAANSSLKDKVVVISVGKNYTFLPYADFRDIVNVTIKIDGTLFSWHENVVDWPNGMRKTSSF